MNPAAKLRLVSTDFDGTIHEDCVRPGIPHALQHKLAALQKSGVTWVINTGRDLASLQSSLEHADIGIRPDYVVVVERNIFRRVGLSEYVPVEPWNSNCTQEHSGLFEDMTAHLTQLEDHLRKNFRLQLYADPYSPLCIIAADDLQMDQIESVVRGALRRFPSSQVVRNSIYLRLAHQAYSKGTALAEIQRLLGIFPEHTVVAGDHLNDLPMLDRTYAHHLISPQNSVPPVRHRVRQQGGYLAKKNAGLGTLEGLEALGF